MLLLSHRDLSQYRLNTSSENKLEEFAQVGLRLPTTRIDLPEPNSSHIDVIRYKASRVGQRVLVEDTAFDVEGASVGVNVKWMLSHLPSFLGRKAIFTSLIGVLEPDNLIYIYKGETSGVIVEPRGNGGFGFDQLFLPDGQTKTFGESKPRHLSPRMIAAREFLRNAPWKIVPPMPSWDGEMQNA